MMTPAADHVDGEDKRIIQRSEIATLDVPSRGMTIINESQYRSGIDCSKLSSGFSLMRCRQKEKPRTNPGLDKAGKTAIMKIEKGATGRRLATQTVTKSNRLD